MNRLLVKVIGPKRLPTGEPDVEWRKLPAKLLSGEHPPLYSVRWDGQDWLLQMNEWGYYALCYPGCEDLSPLYQPPSYMIDTDEMM